MTPLFATCFGGMLSICLASFLEFKTLASFLSLGALFALTSVNLSLIHLRHHEASRSAPWAYLVTYVLAVCAATMTWEVGFEFLQQQPMESVRWWLGFVCIVIFILCSSV